ncbi:Glycosyltransferase [Desulfonema limicola]|uniref:Glycosyltransferase n=1 Tax=Desulfonema limicola TaxID=45656 RepID=A0A975BAW0_9BACT|nr:glycosyltransferase [Desulfonema limicola]QTA81917.1 Glycosyltransferase [Desulfonema limicola]
MEPSKENYRQKRIAHWNRVSRHFDKNRQIGSYYHKLIQHYYKFLIPEGLKIIELGCGHGDLLASLKPCLGVGIDFSGEMLKIAEKKHPDLIFVNADAHETAFKEQFDIIILSDLINDLWDVQTLFENLRSLCHQKTRIILNYYNNLWRIPFSAARFFNLGSDTLEQNWFSHHDVFNLLHLSGFEVVKHTSRIIFPLKARFISDLANKYLVHLVPFNWFALTTFVTARPAPKEKSVQGSFVSVIIPARNEAGNIESIIKRVPELGSDTELVFVEGHSADSTYETIKRKIEEFPEKKCRLFQQTGKGKGDAVRLGFEKAKGNILMILDADMTVPPEDLTRFYNAIVSGKGEFINGVRLVYPLEDQSMRFLNILGNKFFSLAFSWLLGQPIKDTLCGTKVLWKKDYELIAKNRSYFGDFDPFGDFDLLFGAAKLNFRIVEIPVRYRSRTYGDTNIDRWKHGWLLIKMVIFAAKLIKFI